MAFRGNVASLNSNAVLPSLQPPGPSPLMARAVAAIENDLLVARALLGDVGSEGPPPVKRAKTNHEDRGHGALAARRPGGPGGARAGKKAAKPASARQLPWTFENGHQVFLLDDDDKDSHDVTMGGTSSDPAPLLTNQSVQPRVPVTPRKETAPAMTAKTPVIQSGAVPALVRSTRPAGVPLPSSPIERPETVHRPQAQRRSAHRASLSLNAAADPRLVHSRFADAGPRPYLTYAVRCNLLQATEAELRKQLGQVLADDAGTRPAVVHVDFSPEEIFEVLQAARTATAAGVKTSQKKDDRRPTALLRRLRKALVEKPRGMTWTAVWQGLSRRPRLQGRTYQDITAFLEDVVLRRRFPTAVSTTAPNALVLELRDRGVHAADRRTGRLNALLFARSAAGQQVWGRVRELGTGGVVETLRRFREDSLRLRGEWTSCAGDIATVSWTSADVFLCGTTTHMDHQYNRQGNLVLGAVGARAGAGSLRAYPDHRVQWTGPRRPGSNPWLYTSVVSSDFDATHKLAFTAGFDRAVRTWRVDPAGASMAPVAVWPHMGRVNFVAASSDAYGLLVATASDVVQDAVRVYRWAGEAPMASPPAVFLCFSCSRIADAAGAGGRSWAYLPATLRWGLAPAVRHLLLVGFSPRGLSVSAEDDDIPEERKNTGELCLWDGRRGARWRISSGASQNVFEVAWHPTQPCFAAATSPVGNLVEPGVRTQIRVFAVGAAAVPASSSDDAAVSEVHILDCYAEDINELALRPNSTGHLYVAAGCTNGRAYVWDTARGGLPVHVLAHGRFLEEQSGDKISVEDTGVKFVAWGATPDRLYTGSSDGLVKVWNVRAPPQLDRRGKVRSSRDARSPVFVRDLLECKASVSFGAFSPDRSRLVVGDASGRVFLLAVDGGRDDEDDEGPISEEDEDEDEPTNAPTPLLRRHPPEIIRHATPPPPPGEDKPGQQGDADSGCFLARQLLRAGRLRLVPDATVGAVQGPNYAETGLFAPAYHSALDPSLPLLATFERNQQENRPHARDAPYLGHALGDVWAADALDDEDAMFIDSSDNCPLSFSTPWKQRARVQEQHRKNLACDLCADQLPQETVAALMTADRGALCLMDDAAVDYDFAYEEMPKFMESGGC